MARRTLGMVSMRFKPDKKRVFGDVTDIDGEDLLFLFHGFIRDLPPDDLVNTTRGTYVKVEDLKPSGRTVLVRTESGPFGEEGKTIDVATHTVAHNRTADQSATTMTRTLLVVPPGSTYALFLIERQNGATGGTTLFDLFKRAMLTNHSDHFFPDETIIESDAWSADADLKSVTAVAYDFPVNIADGTTARAIPAGVLRQTLEPPAGSKYLPRWLWDMLRNQRVAASQFMGFENRDIDDVVVDLERGSQTKRYILGKESQPSIRIEITAPGQQPLTDIEFARRAAEEAKNFYRGLGLTWDDQWLTGAWSAADEAVVLTR